MTDIPNPPPPDVGLIPDPPLVAYSTTDYAGFWQRAGARVLDMVILGALAMVCFAPAIIAMAAGDTEIVECTVDDDGDVITGFDLEPNALCEEPTDETVILAIVLGLAGAVPLILLLVWFYRREGRTGLTWGRKATGTRLVDANTGLPIGGGRAFGRSVFAGNISLYALGIGFLWAIWDPRKQTWHDKVVTSVVVRA